MKKYSLLVLFILLMTNHSMAQSLYFPPLSQSATWDTLSPLALGWCPDKIDSLYQFLEQENSKGFMVLKDGKIVLEKYFGTFTKDSTWYWASAGKSMTSFLVGKAQEEGYLDIQHPTALYLGSGWTSCTGSQENVITVLHQLTMTTGLDDGVPNNDCTLDTCLIYKAMPSYRWAYHNAPYTLLGQVVENTTNTTYNNYTQLKLKDKTGMTGSWVNVDFNTIFFSKMRSMARYGLLAQNKFIWNQDTLLHDTTYRYAMTHMSQNLNRSYGYLWWLNGQSSYMLPSSQAVFPGSLAPDAPQDMFAALGKNGQMICISPAKGLVMVRMGEAPSSPASDVPNVFCNQIWQKLNAAMCTPTTITTLSTPTPVLFPNPSHTLLDITDKALKVQQITLYTIDGRRILPESTSFPIDIQSLPKGVYQIHISVNDKIHCMKFVKN